MIVSDALQQIRALMYKNNELAKMIPFVVKERGQKEKSRFENLLDYDLDQRTIELLNKHLDEWMAQPSIFENYIKSSQWALMNPWTRAASDHLETEQDDI